VVNYFRDKNVHFVEKSDNSLAVPEARPIEKFWSILKARVYNKNWQATNVEQLQARIKLCLEKIETDLVNRFSEVFLL
jgi:hypothetical protein